MRSSTNLICGVDEVGRGPWAGPILAAAVILPDEPSLIPDGIRDSKVMTRKARAEVSEALRSCACWGIGLVEAADLDRIGLNPANDLAMTRAIAAMPARPSMALIDGNRMPRGLRCPAQTIIGGDASNLAIAAASIIAKVARDAIMSELARRFPGYGWESNAGYGVRAHRDAIKRLGITPQHRRCFQPIRQHLLEEKSTNI